MSPIPQNPASAPLSLEGDSPSAASPSTWKVLAALTGAVWYTYGIISTSTKIWAWLQTKIALHQLKNLGPDPDAQQDTSDTRSPQRLIRRSSPIKVSNGIRSVHEPSRNRSRPGQVIIDSISSLVWCAAPSISRAARHYSRPSLIARHPSADLAVQFARGAICEHKYLQNSWDIYVNRCKKVTKKLQSQAILLPTPYFNGNIVLKLALANCPSAI